MSCSLHVVHFFRSAGVYLKVGWALQALGHCSVHFCLVPVSQHHHRALESALLVLCLGHCHLQHVLSHFIPQNSELRTQDSGLRPYELALDTPSRTWLQLAYCHDHIPASLMNKGEDKRSKANAFEPSSWGTIEQNQQTRSQQTTSRDRLANTAPAHFCSAILNPEVTVVCKA